MHGWYNFVATTLNSVRSFCQFLINIAWHYAWYCGPQVKKTNYELWEKSKQKPIVSVIRDAWQWRNEQ